MNIVGEILIAGDDPKIELQARALRQLIGMPDHRIDKGIGIGSEVPH
jgi:hypothetical protein